MNQLKPSNDDFHLVRAVHCFAKALICMLFVNLSLPFFNVTLAQASDTPQINRDQTKITTEPLLNEIEKNKKPKHCVQKIELKAEHIFMKDNWQQIAEVKTKEKWSKSVIKRFGTVYSNWKMAKNKKYECTRIGFGNDKAGNVGTSVICLIEAEPCVVLLDK